MKQLAGSTNLLQLCTPTKLSWQNLIWSVTSGPVLRDVKEKHQQEIHLMTEDIPVPTADCVSTHYRAPVLFHLQLSKTPTKHLHPSFCWDIWVCEPHGTTQLFPGRSVLRLWTTRSTEIFNKWQNFGKRSTSLLTQMHRLYISTYAKPEAFMRTSSTKRKINKGAWENWEIATCAHTQTHGISTLVSGGRQFVRILCVYREERDSINNVASWLRESTKSN